ncbi:MAG: 5-deoxy-glucuronate isomerase [Bacillota bacterium]
MYYFNVMAGPERAWRFHIDPAFQWLSGEMSQKPAGK